MMIERQRLEYNDGETNSPTIAVYFQESTKPIDFTVEEVIETVLNALKCSTTALVYLKQC